MQRTDGARTRAWWASRAIRVLVPIGLLSGVVAVGVLPALGAQGTDVAGFDLDAEIVRDGALDDWADGDAEGEEGILQQTPDEEDDPCALTEASEGVLICDDVKNDSDTFTGGNKESNPAGWSFQASQVTPKTDITNAYATGRFNTDGDPILINAMERLPKSGSLNLDFEFNKVVDETTDIPQRSEGDVLIAYDLGGARASDAGAISVKVFVADANGVYDYANPDFESTGTGGVTQGGVTARLNSETIPCGPWGCYDEQGAAATTLPPFSFAEVGVNLDDAVGLSDVCLNYVTVRSRASESVTSQLKDTTEPTDFPFCGGLEVRKYLDVGTSGLGVRHAGEAIPETELFYENDVDTKAEDTEGDLAGWAIEVRGPKVSESNPGPLVCDGTTDETGLLVCGEGEDLSQVLPGVYTITETGVATGFYNTDPGGNAPYSKEVTVALGGDGTTAYVGNTCLSSMTFDITSVPTGTNAPTSVTVEYEVNGGTSQTLALAAKGSPNQSTWSGTLANLKPGDSIDWRFYINGDTATKKTGRTDDIAPGYPTCSTTKSASFGTVTLNGTKYKDANADGDKDTGENGIGGYTTGGFTFELWYANADGTKAGTAAIASTTSAADGTYSFTGVQVGRYLVDEVSIPTGWVQTEPASDGTRAVTVGLNDTGSKTVAAFGNTPLSKVDVSFTALGDLPSGNDATEATTMTCYTGYGTASQNQVGTTTSNALSVTNLKTSQSVVTCTIAFQDP